MQSFFDLLIDLSARVTEISFLGDRLQCFDEVKDARCLKREVAHDVQKISETHDSKGSLFAFVSNFNL